jgi:hypothetical protein
MPSIHKFKDKMWLIDREKGLVYNRENETYNFLKRNVQFSLFFTPSKQRHLITI